MAVCEHVIDTPVVKAHDIAGCEECLKTGGWWVHLRSCLACGYVGCCESSPGKHATAHYQSAGHPVVKSMEPGEDWAWCYIDELEMEPAPRPD
jgi:uncharacterized UBP type Zn finger protein